MESPSLCQSLDVSLDGIAPAAPARSGYSYDATEPSPRRRSPPLTLKGADDELPSGKRAAMVSTTRDTRRNFAIAAWAIRKHLDYVSSFTFQARTGSEELDGQIERLMTRWSQPANCDIAERHPLARMIRLSEALRTVDGDCLWIRLASGHAQIVEGDRLRDPYRAVPIPTGQQMIHGVMTNRVGKALSYAVHRRGLWGGGFEFERMVPADNSLLHGYYDRIDQTRGISPLSAALNTLRDTYEGFEYALAKAKINQLFGIKFKRAAADAFPTSADSEAAQYEVDFGKGNWILDLETGDDCELMETAHPSDQFQSFTTTMIAVALKSLDIPFSFYDESFSTYSGSRQAWIQYDQSAILKRRDNLHLLTYLTAWQLVRWIANGGLVLPAGITADDLRWEWLATGVPWIDPLKEIQADVTAVDAGLSSRTRILKAQGIEFADIVRELAEEERLLSEKKIVLPGFQPIAIPPDPPPIQSRQQRGFL